MKLKNIDNMCAYLLSFLAISVSHYICVEKFLTISGFDDDSVLRLKYLNFELTELTQIKRRWFSAQRRIENKYVPGISMLQHRKK